LVTAKKISALPLNLPLAKGLQVEKTPPHQIIHPKNISFIDPCFTLAIGSTDKHLGYGKPKRQ